MAALYGFIENSRKESLITGTFTTNKSEEEISGKKLVMFQLTLFSEKEHIKFDIPNKNKEYGFGITRNKLLRIWAKPSVMFLRWTPEQMEPYEGFSVTLSFNTEKSGVFILHILHFSRYSAWKRNLEKLPEKDSY